MSEQEQVRVWLDPTRYKMLVQGSHLYPKSVMVYLFPVLMRANGYAYMALMDKAHSELTNYSSHFRTSVGHLQQLNWVKVNREDARALVMEDALSGSVYKPMGYKRVVEDFVLDGVSTGSSVLIKGTYK